MKMKQSIGLDDVSSVWPFPDDENIGEEAHYWMLVDNVARWMFEHKETTILSDIEHKVLQLYREYRKGLNV